MGKVWSHYVRRLEADGRFVFDDVFVGEEASGSVVAGVEAPKDVVKARGRPKKVDGFVPLDG